jgi:hypothetical protein
MALMHASAAFLPVSLYPEPPFIIISSVDSQSGTSRILCFTGAPSIQTDLIFFDMAAFRLCRQPTISSSFA